jgi:hypothetical protein
VSILCSTPLYSSLTEDTVVVLQRSGAGACENIPPPPALCSASLLLRDTKKPELVFLTDKMSTGDVRRVSS